MNNVSVVVYMPTQLDIGALSKANAAALLSVEFNKILKKYHIKGQPNVVEVVVNDDGGEFAKSNLEE